MAHLPDVLVYGDAYTVCPPREAYDEIVMHLRLWGKAFQPWLDDASRRGGLDFIAAATLRGFHSCDGYFYEEDISWGGEHEESWFVCC